jgi:diguanylate cyclase (GGDEF)-like protein
LALLLVNIDGFTIYNAEFGEHRGDACLRSVADALRSVAHRPADTLGRYAGGKFAILLPETDARGASTVAQRAIDAVEALQIWHAASAATDRVTLSVGGGCRVFSSLTKGAAAADSSAHTRNTGTVADDLIAAAEHALTEARTAGGSKSRIIDLADPENARSALALN